MPTPLRQFLLGLLCLGVALQSQAAGLVEVVAKSKRSVVAVGTFNAFDNPRFRFRGTGFVVGDGNLLVTNAHVLPEPDNSKANVAIQVANGVGPPEIRPASVAALDRTHDLALLRFEGGPVPALQIAEAENIHEGLSVAFIGFPVGGVLGYTPVTHRGIISSITAVAMPMPNSRQLSNQAVRRLREGSFDVYQLDATAYPGNSGGPVLDAETGEVVGVINLVLVKSTKEAALSQPSGISYAVPARFVDDLIKGK
jgi:S1-C subfamily serine protease